MNKYLCLVRRTIAVIVLGLLAGLVNKALAGPEADKKSDEPLKQLSLAQLGDVEVTTASKEPEEVWRTPAAVIVVCQVSKIDPSFAVLLVFEGIVSKNSLL
jgi:hypothetical protein